MELSQCAIIGQEETSNLESLIPSSEIQVCYVLNYVKSQKGKPKEV